MDGKTVGFGILRAVLSLATGAISLFTMSSFLSPAGISPTGAMPSFIPFQSFFGSLSGQATDSISSVLPIGRYLPLLAGGGSGFVVWMILSKILGKVQTMTHSSSSPKINPADMMKSFGMNLPSSNLQFPSVGSIPEKLPSDITKIQYVILQSFQRGYNKSKDIAKQNNMENKDMEKEIDILKNNGYVTKNSKLTSKAVELLSA
ncbi:MAG TPA: hypothetical protein VFG24_05180 [Nitrosopumilaceae archaeon]|nr:hypothetical protein [Nitrosopumilaceae archaeon]